LHESCVQFISEVYRLTIRVAIADDHPILLAGMQYLMSGMRGVMLVGVASDSTELVDVLGRQPCDVVVTDYAMPGGQYGDGTSLFGFLHRRFPALRLVVLTGLDSMPVLSTILAAGVDAIVGKMDDPEHLHAAVLAAHGRQRYLSPAIREIVGMESTPPSSSLLSRRETEVVRLFAQGLSAADIGEMVGRSRKTISVQKMSAIRKLGLANDAELIRYALVHGLIQGSQNTKLEGH
jgi:two-component system, NarL family, captular synthesis response regulator RcsB